MPETILNTAIVTLARVKEQLVIATANTTYDDRLTQEINYVTGQAEQFCNRPLIGRVWTDLSHDGDGTSELLLREYPASSFTAAKRYQSDGVTTVAMTITGARILKERILVLPQDSFDPGSDAALITYTAGYIAGSHDRQIKALQGAALEWIQLRWKAFRDGTVGSSSIGIGGESIQLDSRLPDSIARALESFRRFP